MNEKFDVILCLEIVEHVQNLDIFLKASSELLKKNGIIFIATINRTFQSYLKAIIGAEYILKWLPIGTHDWNKFLTPKDLEIITNKNNFMTDEIVGMKFDLFSNEWNKGDDTSVNYISTFLKN